jgi:hypothetical protein
MTDNTPRNLQIGNLRWEKCHKHHKCRYLLEDREMDASLKEASICLSLAISALPFVKITTIFSQAFLSVLVRSPGGLDSLLLSISAT